MVRIKVRLVEYNVDVLKILFRTWQDGGLKGFLIKVIVQIDVYEKILVLFWPLVKDVLENKFVFLLKLFYANGYARTELHAGLQLIQSDFGIELEVYL